MHYVIMYNWEKKFVNRRNSRYSDVIKCSKRALCVSLTPENDLKSSGTLYYETEICIRISHPYTFIVLRRRAFDKQRYLRD